MNTANCFLVRYTAVLGCQESKMFMYFNNLETFIKTKTIYNKRIQTKKRFLMLQNHIKYCFKLTHQIFFVWQNQKQRIEMTEILLFNFD